MLKLLIFTVLIFKFINLKAHHKIYSPRVEEGRQSLEWRGHFNYDDRLEFKNLIIMFLKRSILGQFLAIRARISCF